MKNFLIVLALLVGFAIGVWYGHWFWRRPIVMTIDAYKEVVPHLEPGDHLIWTDQTRNTGDTSVAVDFTFGNGKLLCEPPSSGNTEANIHECVVRAGVGKKPFSYYTYKCHAGHPCNDPDAGGGSDSAIYGQGGKRQNQQGQNQQGQLQAMQMGAAAAAVAASTIIGVYCDANGKAAADTDGMSTPTAASPGQQIQWKPEGGIPPGNWSVGAPQGTNGTLYPVCGVGTYKDASVCTVVNNAVNTTYNVTVQGCSAGSAQINIMRAAKLPEKK